MYSIEIYFHEMLNRDQTKAQVLGKSVKVYESDDDAAHWLSDLSIVKF